MIESFKIVNFRSIIDLKVEFCYGETTAPRHFETSETWAFLPTRRGRNGRFVPVMAMYGANASGKSNIVNAFLNFTRLTVQGIGGCYQPNKLEGKADCASYSVQAALDCGRFRYDIVYDGTHIRREELVQLADKCGEGDKLLYRVADDGYDFSGIVKQGYDAEQMLQAIRVECVNSAGEFIRPFLSCLKRRFPGLSDAAAALFDEFSSRIQVSCRNEFFISRSIDLLAQSGTPEARELAVSKIVKVLRKFDFGVKGMRIARQRVGKSSASMLHGGAMQLNPQSIASDDGDAWIVDEIKVLHENAEGERKALDFMTEESDGTKVVAALIGVCLWVLETGRMLFVDELDRSLHPFILSSIIRMFKSKRYNKTNAQLIFTAHDPTPLEEDFLRVSEVGIVGKTIAGGTSFRRLCEFGDVRNASNFRRQYLAGSYSGIPFPYI